MNRLLATAALALALGVATVPAFADDVTITIHRTIPATDNDQPDMHAAYGMHSDFVGLGMQMQLNLSCQNGGAIHLDDYPLNDDRSNFRAANPGLAHKWAMEGVYWAQSHPHSCS